MKTIGMLYGREKTFPPALIDYLNAHAPEGIRAEAVSINKVIQGEASPYAVILDRISQDVPFYRAYLKNAALTGTAVVNNPFWWSADEKFFNNALATQIGAPVPRTVLLPSCYRPEDTSEESFRNLEFPLDWEGIFAYIGFPAFFKPYAGGGWKSVYKVNNPQEFFEAYEHSGNQVMMLQENVDFQYYFRCYYVGGQVRIMPYDPRLPFEERYLQYMPDYPPGLWQNVEDLVRRLNEALGYDFNTVEFAVRDGVPYAIDFCNPAPDADHFSVGQENFQWVLENAARMLIERAEQQAPGQDNLTWGQFVRQAQTGELLST